MNTPPILRASVSLESASSASMVPAAVLFSTTEKDALLEKAGWELLGVVPPDEPLPPELPEPLELSGEDEPPPPPPPQEPRRSIVRPAASRRLLIVFRKILTT